MAKKYWAEFKAREKNSSEIIHPHVATFSAENEKEAEKKVYEDYQDISELKILEVVK